MRKIIAVLLSTAISFSALGKEPRPMQLSADQLTVPIESADQSTLLEDWEWLVGKGRLPIVVTTMGDAFVHDVGTGEIFFLDTIGGKLERVSSNLDEFTARLDQDPEFVSNHFSTDLKSALQSGMRLGSRRVFSFKVPPALGGAQELANLESSDIEVHFSLLGQMLGKIHDLPAGTKVKLRLGEPDSATEQPGG